MVDRWLEKQEQVKYRVLALRRRLTASTWLNVLDDIFFFLLQYVEKNGSLGL